MLWSISSSVADAARDRKSSTVTRRAAARSGASVFSISVRARRRVGQWLIASVTCTVAGCTLIDGGFEPTLVDDTGSPESTGAPAPSPLPEGPRAGEESTAPAASSDDREGPPDVRSAPGQPSVLDTGGVSAVSGTADPGVTVTGVGQADAGVVVDGDTEVVPVPPAGEPCAGSALGGSCYQLFDELVSWDAAEQSCVAWGGHLASIESQDEDQSLNAWPLELGITGVDDSGIWVGGTDARGDGEFLWVVGTPFAFTSWAPTQPDNGAGIDCVEKRNDGAGGWYDRRCTDALRYLCERPL
jgi:lectin-like protein